MIGIITQARLGSTRLPKKILKEVKGVTLLQHQINRISKLDIKFIVATTTETADATVADYCNKNNINVFRGSEKNVLERFYKCAKEFGLTTVIRITSDCPLIAPEIIKKGIDLYLENEDKNLYVSNILKRTYPRGFDFEIFSFNLLEKAFKEATEDYQKEHVTPYIWEAAEERGVKTLDVFEKQDFSRYRITVDTEEDFELIEKLIQDFNADQLSGKEIISVLEKNPELVEINRHIEQKKVK